MYGGHGSDVQMLARLLPEQLLWHLPCMAADVGLANHA